MHIEAPVASEAGADLLVSGSGVLGTGDPAIRTRALRATVSADA